MEPKKLAAWMKQEGIRVNELSRTLQEHIVSIPAGDRTEWLAELGRRYDHFVAHLQRMMLIEEEDGYLLPVVEQRPTLGEQVEALRHQHDELRRLMQDLERTVRSLKTDDQLLIRDCCLRLQMFLNHVGSHDEHEQHIVLYSFTQDIGTDH